MKRAQEASSSSSPPGTEVRESKKARLQSGPAAPAPAAPAPPRKMFRCTVHDSIYLEALLVQIVDTPHFQRLASTRSAVDSPVSQSRSALLQ